MALTYGQDSNFLLKTLMDSGYRPKEIDNKIHQLFRLIEHFRPQKQYPELKLEYNNLLCSCQFELQKTEPRHCGNAKGSWFDENLTISPLEPSCESNAIKLGSKRSFVGWAV
ncbi:MAG: hypothetical protein ABFS56_26535 [Pseudomonadota bacterium]